MPDIIHIQTQKQLALNNTQVFLKSALTDLHAHNFMRAKTSLRACCVQAHHCAHNLLSPGCVNLEV